MQTIQQFPLWFSKQKLSGKVAIGCAGLFMLCCLCSVPISILNPPTPMLTPTTIVIPSTTPSLIVTNTPLSTTTFTPEPTITFTLVPTDSPFPTSTTTSAFTILVLTSPVQAGGNAFVQIQTVAGTNCFLSYTTPSGSDSEATGLGTTTANSNGVCSWTWKIGPQTNSGTGSLAITANGTTQFFNIVIQ